jgi:cytoskeletal protein CcmA (bactofilin family)
MFSSRKQPKLDVIVGSETIFRGELESKGTVRIDGRMEGNVIAGCLIIGAGGIVTGDVEVREMIVGGRHIGNIRASEGVEIQPTGEVYGDIASLRLAVAEGGRFDGRSRMQRPMEIPYKVEDTVVSDFIEEDSEATETVSLI